MVVGVARTIARFLLVALAKPPVDDAQFEGLAGSSSEEKCPHCAARYRYSSEKIANDGSVSCMNCGKRFMLEHLPQETIDIPKVGMLCPSCKGMMEKGYVVGGGGIYWNKEVPHVFDTAYSAVGESFWPLSNYRRWGNSPHLPAFRCRACRIVVIKVPVDQTEDGRPTAYTTQEKCPHCAAVYVYKLDKIDRNRTVVCHNCGRRFQLSSLP